MLAQLIVDNQLSYISLNVFELDGEKNGVVDLEDISVTYLEEIYQGMLVKCSCAILNGLIQAFGNY